MEYVSKTQHYLKVKKPLLERQRRARINKCLDSMKHIIADLQKDGAILRMDKAEMLEAAISYLRQTKCNRKEQVNSFRNGYINAANEVSRVLASTRGMSAELGKSVMTQLGCQFNRFEESNQRQQNNKKDYMQPLIISTVTAPLSPASSGYHSDMDMAMDSPASSPSVNDKVWRPW